MMLPCQRLSPSLENRRSTTREAVMLLSDRFSSTMEQVHISTYDTLIILLRTKTVVSFIYILITAASDSNYCSESRPAAPSLFSSVSHSSFKSRRASFDVAR